MSEFLLEVRDLDVTAGAATLVSGVSLALAAGTIHGIVGESGSGKSMTASAIAGLLPHGVTSTGAILLNGTDLSALSATAARRTRTEQIGFVFQNPRAALNPRIPVGRQIGEALRPEVRADEAAAVGRALQLLDEVGVPRAKERLAAYPHELSGGLAQRVVIAMALARDPRLLIADEPTTALDSTIQAQILDLIQTVQRERDLGVILITHDMGIVQDRTDEITVLADHAVVEQGRTLGVLERPTQEKTRALIAGAHLGDEFAPAPPAAEGTPVFEVNGVSKRFESRLRDGHVRVNALRNVSIRVERGRSLGIVGESGSGKTTLARLLLGLEQQDSGEVLFEGESVDSLSRTASRHRRAAVQYVFQDPWSSLNPHLSIGTSIAEPLRGAGWNRTDRGRRVAEVMHEVALPVELIARRPSQLSGGQLQRAAIARALALRPQLLIADEPVASLDVTVQARVIAVLERLREEFGLTYVLISHDLRVVRRLTHDLVVLRDGEVVERGTTQEIFTAPKHDYTRELLDAIPGSPHPLITVP